MTAPVLTLFNNKGGVGKTSIIYHLAWAFSDRGWRVVAADMDPQANLTAAFLDDEQIDRLWEESAPGSTVFHCVKPLLGVGDIAAPQLRAITPDLHLLPGDVALSSFEDTLSNEWPNSMGNSSVFRPLRVLSAFGEILRRAAEDVAADITLIDIGPNLGAINRSALLATDFVVMPLGADLFSLRGLSHLGQVLNDWRDLWRKRVANWDESRDKSRHGDLRLPAGRMQPLGYLCQRYSERLSRPVGAYAYWAQRIPKAYSRDVLEREIGDGVTPDNDPNCLAVVQHYRGLVTLGQERRKPIFKLTSADGAIGAQGQAVAQAKKDFGELADTLSQLIGLDQPAD